MRSSNFTLTACGRKNQPDRWSSEDCPDYDGAADYLFTSVVGVDVQTTPGVAQLEVTTQGGPWGGWIWSIDWATNYWIALEALIRYKAKKNEPPISLMVPLTSDTPSFTLIQRANSEIRRVQFGLSLDSKAHLRYPEESRERNRSERMDRNLTARFGVSRETAKDFMLAFGRALHSDNFRVSVLNSNILKPFRKTLHSTLLLYVVFGSLPEKRGKDVEPTCNQVQVAVIRGTMVKTPTGVDEDDPQGWPVEGSEVVVLDAPSNQSYRLGYDDVIVVVPRDSVKVNKMVLKYNPAVQHVTMAFSRKEIEKDGVLHMELMQLSARAAGMLFLPENYNGWEVE